MSDQVYNVLFLCTGNSARSVIGEAILNKAGAGKFVARAPSAVPYAVGLYITSAYWFTASTSFANPAVTIARSLSDTFSGIAPAGVPAFVVAQMVGLLAAVLVGGWLWQRSAAKPT